MKLEKFKERDNKRIGIIIFTIMCILLVSGVILYRTFAIFEVKTNQNVIKGTVQDPGNIYFAFYVNDEIQKEMPTKNYVLDEDKSFCGTNGERDTNIKVTLTDEYGVYVTGMTTSRTKCNLYFVKGAFILGKPIKAVTSGNGLYEVIHEDVSETLNDDGFKETEWRYAGASPNNYVTFNDEKWQIIGLVNVMVNESHKVEQRVKIIRNDSIGTYSWDENNTNDWTKATLMNIFNTNYYTNNLDSIGLNTFATDLIDQNIIWNLGGAASESINFNEMYNYERGDNHAPSQWSNDTDNFHSIGLLYPTDYGYATSGGVIGRNQCLNSSLTSWHQTRGNINLHINCDLNDWLTPKEIYEWSMSPDSKNNLHVWDIDQYGGVFLDTSVSTNYSWRGVRPVLYLKPNVKITGGTGEEAEPFKITLMIE